MKRNRKVPITILVSGLIASSIIGISTSSALTVASSKNETRVTALDQYKADYAAYKAAIISWNANRVQQIATFMDTRNKYLALMLSNQSARLEISKERVATVTAANSEYATEVVKATTATAKKSLLTTRNSTITAATALAKSKLAALPVLGAKPVWPAAQPRPVKPTKPATS